MTDLTDPQTLSFLDESTAGFDDYVMVEYAEEPEPILHRVDVAAHDDDVLWDYSDYH